MSSNPRVSISPVLSSEGTSSQDEESHAESLEQALPFFAIPPHPPSGTTLNDLLGHAMDRILTYEVTQRGLKVRSLLMGLLDWLPENGQRFLANLLCISLTDDFDAIYQHIYTHLCVAMYAANLKRHRTTSLLGEEDDKVMAPCFVRDDYRCVVSGFLDESAWLKEDLSWDVQHARLEAAYIIPYGYGHFASQADRLNSAKHWDCLRKLFPEIMNAVSPQTIDNLCNRITLHPAIRRDFERFECAFKKSPGLPNTYEFITFPRFTAAMGNHVPSRVTLFAQEPYNDSDLPSPTLLDCHYRLASLFHIYGIDAAVRTQFGDWRRTWETVPGGSLDPRGFDDVADLLGMVPWGTVPR